MPTHAASLRAGCVIIASLLVFVAGGAALAPAPAAARPVSLPVAGLVLPPGARILGPLPARYPLRLIVGLAPRHADALAALVRARRRAGARTPVLSPGQFADLFSPTPTAYTAVAAFLHAHDLRVVRTYPDRLLLDATGAAGQVAAAFGTSLVRYRDRAGGVHYSNVTPPRLPPDLAGLVATVVGLRDDGTLHHGPRPHLRLVARSYREPGRAPQLPPASMLTPSQLLAAYDVAPLYSPALADATGITATVAVTGTGQTIAVYELSPFNPADIATFDAIFGLTATAPISVAVDGGATNTFGGTGTAEAALDVEWVQAVAPGARILVYNGPAAPNGTDTTGADDTYARIVNDNQAQLLSTSWGQCEPDQQADTPPDLALLHNLFAQAVAEGMTVLAASGDAGVNDCTDGKPNPSVDYPASDPAIVGVGGTTLTLDGTGAVQGESGWANSGGGSSAVWPRPVWQSGPGLPEGAMREVPDVALNAGRPYAVWVAGGWTGVSGTSGGPPVWAGLLALVNETRYAAAQLQGAPPPAPCAVQPGLGDIHADLYRLGAMPGPTPALRDVTAGPVNGLAAPGPGWDPVTGWGSPDAAVLGQALLADPALAAPTPGPCPTATPVATATPRATATATPGAVATATATATAVARPSPTRTPAPGKSVLTLRVAPGRARAGDVVVVQLRGAPGPQQSVVFEVRYPGQKGQWLLRAVDAHGAATVRVRVPRLSLHGRPLTVWLRVTVRDRQHVLTGWASFRIVPTSTARGHNTYHR